MCWPHTLKNRIAVAAYSLVEVVIATGVLVVALLGIALYFDNALLFQGFGKEYSIANAAANAVLEYCLAMDFIQLPYEHGRVLTLKPESSCPSMPATAYGATLYGLGGSDIGESYTDSNTNKKIDWNDNSGPLNVQRDNIYQVGQTGESFIDTNGNGMWDPPSRCIQLFVWNMECTAFVDTNPPTAENPTLGYKDPNEQYLHETGPNPPGRVFWNDPNPQWNPSASPSGFICPLASGVPSACGSVSVDANRSMRILIRVRWVGSRGNSQLEVRTIRAFY